MVDDYRRMDGLLDELAAVTPADVQRVARAYLGAKNRVVGWFVPEGDGDGGGERIAARGRGTPRGAAGGGVLPAPGARPAHQPNLRGARDAG